MTEKQKVADCPVCQKPAAWLPVDYGVRKEYECPNCGVFQVTAGEPEEHLRSSGVEFRQAFRKYINETPTNRTAWFRRNMDPSAREKVKFISEQTTLRP